MPHCTRKWACGLLATTLLAVAEAEARVPFGFSRRPPAPVHTFPSPGAFQRVPGRRLEAGDGKPERDLYIAEEAGHRFVYEYASDCTADRLLDVDREDSVEALACVGPSGPGAPGTLRLLWRTDLAVNESSTVSRRGLRPGDAVVGGPAWGCGQPGESFSFEVLAVLQIATLAEPITEVLVSAKHPLHFFPNLYVDLTWSGLGLGGRRLDDWTFKPGVFGFNTDSTGAPVLQNIDIGYLRCSDCLASVEPTISFMLRTDGIVPSAVSVRISGALNISMNVGLSPDGIAALEEGWKRISQFFGPELIALAASAAAGSATSGGGFALLPLFNKVTDALNIELRPAIGFDSLLNTVRDILMDSRVRLSVTTDPATTFFELGWSKADGMYVNSSFDFDSQLRYGGVRISEDIVAGLRSCVGLVLNVLNGDEPFAKLEVCPELKAFVQSTTTTGVVRNYPPEIAANVKPADAKLCFDFKSFTTDVDLDILADEPFMEGCFLGKCVQTGEGRFNGETVTFTDGQLCLDIARADLQEADICLHAHEADPGGYQEQYAEPYYLRLNSSTCPGLDCELTENMRPKKGGSKAIMRVRATVTNKRRLQSEVNTETCHGTAVGISLGVSGSFGGFHYPRFFSTGANDEAVHPAGRMPGRRASQPRLLCEAHSAIVSCSPQTIVSKVLLLIPFLFLTIRRGF